MRLTRIVLGALIAMTLAAGWGPDSARASLILYSNAFGVDVNFTDIVETSTTTGPFYGQPAGLANSALSPGVGFLSSAASGEVELVNGRLQMTISADPGFSFSSIRVDQLGSFLGFGDDATVMSSSNATVVTPDGNFSGSLFFGNVGTGAGPWAESFTVSFPATDVVSFTLDHQLLTAAGIGSAAFVDTSSIQISVSAFAVPETSTAVFLALAVTGLGFRYRRRRL